MTQTLTYVIGQDRRPHVDNVQDFKVNFDGSNTNWVQARQYERSMRQVFVNIKNEDGTPLDLTGCNVWFEGLLPKNSTGDFRVIDDKGYVALDPTAGRFRFDMPGHAFTVAGSYRQAFFRILKDGNSITTLEFDLDVLADKVIDGLVPRTYISPVEELINEIEAKYQDSTDKLTKMTSDFVDKFTQSMNTLKALGATVQNGLDALEQKIKQDGLFTQAEADAFKQMILAAVNGLEAKWHDIEVVDYKPTRDGRAHTLSESYASVDEAQKDYPAATSLADTKDWCAITEAIQEGQKQGKNIYLAPGNYFVNKTVKLPTGVTFYGAYQNSKIYASQQMSDDSKKQSLAILEYDEEGQPPIYIENIQVLGSSDRSNQLIGLHLGGNRASKITNFIASYCFAHGTLIHATNPQSADVENATFEHYWQVQSGSFCIKSNPLIDRGNITDFAVYDSQITTLDIHDKSQANTSSPAVEIINDDTPDAVKSIYGIEFTRCFLHAQGNNLVRIVGCHAPRATHSINFDFIKGELHDVHGDLGSGSDKFFLFHLENCWHVMVDHSVQLLYSGASYVEMKNCAFCDIKTAGIIYLGWQHPDSMIFCMDKLCYENHINLVGMDLFLTPGGAEYEHNPNLGYDYGNAYDALDLFAKMRDEGSDNHISGCQLAQTLTLNNEPQRLKNITSAGKIEGLNDIWQNGVTTSLIANSVHTKHVFAKGVKNASLMLPILYKRTSGFLISFRAIGAESDINKLGVLAGSNFFRIPTDQKFHQWTGICPTNVLNAIGIQIQNDNDVLENDVTIEIEYLDCFMENKIPYYPDFVALPAPKVGEANY